VIDDVTSSSKELYLIADNYATHKHPQVQKWLKRDPRFHMYFTPTSSSWLNTVERFFRDFTQQRLRRGIFRDVEELMMAIGEYLDKHNDKPKPFVWTARRPTSSRRLRAPAPHWITVSLLAADH
jgi:hypothetical protein